MISTAHDLWKALHTQQTITTSAPAEKAPIDTANHHQPWYIATLMGVSAWLAGFFVLVFLGLLIEPKQDGAFVLGLVLLLGAWYFFQMAQKQVFLNQLGLACTTAGQCFLLFALTDRGISMSGFAGILVVLQMLLIATMPNQVQRLLSTVLILLAWPWLLSDIQPEAFSSAHILIWGLLIWLPWAALLWAMLRTEATWMAHRKQAVMRPVLTGLVIGLAFASTTAMPYSFLPHHASTNALNSPELALWPLLSALIALCALTAAFALRSKALMGTCMVATFMHLSHFYYQLGVSLLLKSMLMLCAGALMLLVAWFLAKKETP
jgi:hypothetical protein